MSLLINYKFYFSLPMDDIILRLKGGYIVLVGTV